MSEYIGLFWYIDTLKCFIYEKFELSGELHKSGLYITSPIAHPILWETYKNKYGGVKFNHYPRGRVNYHVPKHMFELDMDGCLQKDISIVESICNIFGVDKQRMLIVPPTQTNKNNTNYKHEGHYSCYLCRTVQS